MKKSKKILIYIVAGMSAGFFNGLFGSGGGTLIVPFMTNYLKFDEKKAHATAILIIFSFTLLSLIIYGMNAMIDYKTAILVSSGGVLGGFIGAKLLSKLSDKIIRRIFSVFMILAAIRMLMK